MRTVQAFTAFAPASVARRMRLGLWVDSKYNECSVSEMTNSHALSTLKWITDNEAYYATLLVVHPNESGDRRNRGYYVRASAVTLSEPDRMRSLLDSTRLMRDLRNRRDEIEERKARIEARRPGAISVPVHAEVSFGGGYFHREFGLELEPAPGREKVLELDDGTKIVIGNQQVKIETTGGNVTTISR